MAVVWFVAAMYVPAEAHPAATMATNEVAAATLDASAGSEDGPTETEHGSDHCTQSGGACQGGIAIFASLLHILSHAGTDAFEAAPTTIASHFIAPHHKPPILS